MTEFHKKLGERIRKLREQTNITQDELAERMGKPRPTISLMEKGDRKVSAEELVRLSEVFNIDVEGLLDVNKEPKVVLEQSKTRKEPKPQVRINVPQKKLGKFKQVLLYILKEVGSRPNVGETVIYKLLYFIDFNYYEKYEEQLIGATYVKNRYGPTPREFKKIVDKMIRDKEIRPVKDKYFTYPQTKYLPLKNADLSILKANEKEVIDDVLKRLAHMKADEISEYSHKDVPWLTTENGKNIEYESVFYRTAPYSVRRYDEDIS